MLTLVRGLGLKCSCQNTPVGGGQQIINLKAVASQIIIGASFASMLQFHLVFTSTNNSGLLQVPNLYQSTPDPNTLLLSSHFCLIITLYSILNIAHIQNLNIISLYLHKYLIIINLIIIIKLKYLKTKLYFNASQGVLLAANATRAYV